ncbi:ssDNA-binding domain-containing protein [Dyadobacter sp. CY261]|uniref:ArdC-like ssDNA-binding domain-containing protein n=1 Tax=Dyadobacter sp. CY261 TaxID=2907203 RepID=UPI001EEACC97|nr:ArdC-like ssDNA-binding domain-containing protein [Dyadobacter sp. CY261]MCF0072458.1 ssDNA-binding domain-containing protein [Dyadobacter sp. CY261]
MAFSSIHEDKPQDVYARVTGKIISDLGKGDLTWRKPWNSVHFAGRISLPLRSNSIPYTGINTIILWAESADKGYSLPHWMTYKQAANLKANIIRGEKGTQIVYADKLVKEELDEQGKLATKTFHYLKTYTVFNASQINGLPTQFYQELSRGDTNEHNRIVELEQFFAQTKADIYTGRLASYNQNTDRIQMPAFESFERPIDY